MILGKWCGCLYAYRVSYNRPSHWIELWYGYWSQGAFHRVYQEKLMRDPDWLLHNAKHKGSWVQNRRAVLRDFGYDY